MNGAPYAVGELAAARAILAGLPRDLPAAVVAAIVDGDAALERAQDLLTGELPEPTYAEQDDFERLARSGR